MPALVAIIGRPNVGKSTLFNRILGKRIAIESPVSGTTRDPVTALYEGEDVDILFVDTGGLEFGKQPGTIEEDIQTQARLAIADADIILFCIDTKQEITAGEQEVVTLLRKKAGEKPVFLVGTKAEGKKSILEAGDFYQLGIGEDELFFISALQNAGIFELLDALENTLKQRGFTKQAEPEEGEMRIAVVGRPNVGKSSLVNALTNSHKLIVSDIAGTTRDAVDMEVKWEDKKVVLIDTAGMRKKAKIDERIEKYSLLRGLASMQRADVTLMMIDAEEGATHQDKHIIDHILNAKTGLILIVNKWDLKEKGEEEQKMFLEHLQYELAFISWAPVLFVSALEKRNIHKIFPLAQNIIEERKKRISTGKLNAFLQEVQHVHPISGVRNTRPKIKYGTQVGDSPPHFVFHGSRLEAMHFSSRRYLENRLRETFGFFGTPIHIEMALQKNPYHAGRKIRLPEAAKKDQKKKNQEQKKERKS